jgi:hypothetical protein
MSYIQNAAPKGGEAKPHRVKQRRLHPGNARQHQCITPIALTFVLIDY